MNAPVKESLFRQESIESGRQRLAGAVVASVPPRSRHYSWFAAAIMVVFILFLVFGQYPRRAQVKGIVDYSAGIARIESLADGKIEQIHVREGQRVTRGTPLVTIALSQGQTIESDGVEGQLAELDRQLSELQRQKSLITTLTSSERNALIAQRDSANEAIGSLSRQQALLAQQVRIDDERYKRAARLQKKGAGTKAELEQGQSTFLSSKLSLELQGEKIIGKREELATLESQISGRAISGFQLTSQMNGRMAEIARERSILLRQQRLTLVAPIDGGVGDIALRAGQTVTQKAAIVSILPADSKLEVQLYAPSSAAGFVKPGQTVKLKFDAFPSQKYGTGTGTVTWVSTVPSDGPASFQASDKTEPLFRIRVAIDTKQTSRTFANGTLRAGMTLSANLILEERGLWEVFFGPILKAARN